MCSAAVDGGPELTSQQMFGLAEEKFSMAASGGGPADITNMALVGRARARLNQGNVSGAASDAAQVPAGFVHNARFSPASFRSSNRIWTLNNRDERMSVESLYWNLEYMGTPDPREGRVELALPDRADTGLSVPLEVSVPGSPMTEEDHVKSMHVLTTRNPQPLVTDYRLTPRSGVARVAQRIRLAQSQYVFAFARMSDGSAWMTARHVSVSLGACAVEIFLPDAERAKRRRK